MNVIVHVHLTIQHSNETQMPYKENSYSGIRFNLDGGTPPLVLAASYTKFSSSLEALHMRFHVIVRTRFRKAPRVDAGRPVCGDLEVFSRLVPQFLFAECQMRLGPAMSQAR